MVLKGFLRAFLEDFFVGVLPNATLCCALGNSLCGGEAAAGYFQILKWIHAALQWFLFAADGFHALGRFIEQGQLTL